MLDRRVLIVGLAVCSASAMPVAAQMDHPAPVCTTPAPLQAELASWRTPVTLVAARDIKGIAQATLQPGRAATVTLAPTPTVTYPLRPEKPGAPATFGGLATFTVKQAGTWRVALGTGAWIDVVRNGKAARSVAHGHGPDCTGVRKMVDYQLTPGIYTLQLAGSASNALTVLVTRLP